MFNCVKIERPTEIGMVFAPVLWKDVDVPVAPIFCTFSMFFTPMVKLIFLSISIWLIEKSIMW
jgi:hypothetical protein